MLGGMRAIVRRHKDFFIYMIFGACATAINMGTYALLRRPIGMANVPATILAWVFAVTFAFFTNKVIVFSSKDFTRKNVLVELVAFFSCRLATGVLDVFVMWLAVDVLELTPLLWKFISNLIAGVINFTVGKLLIFRKRNRPFESDDAGSRTLRNGR
jgi:putative flippase GtrA